jgi:hypothetical protein
MSRGGLDDALLCSSSSAVSADEAAREYGDGIAGRSWSATLRNGFSSGANNRACGDGAAEATLSGRDPWSCHAPFGSSGVGNRILGRRVRSRREITRRNTLRTSRPSTAFGDKAVGDSASR